MDNYGYDDMLLISKIIATEEENDELREKLALAEKSNRNWRRKCQRLRAKIRELKGEENGSD